MGLQSKPKKTVLSEINYFFNQHKFANFDIHMLKEF